MEPQTYCGRQINIYGLVQGIGYRPYIFRLAATHRLKGYVFNTPAGVTIHVEGRCQVINKFYSILQKDPHPLALINYSTIQSVEVQNCVDFTILKSRGTARSHAFIAPDIGTCDDCMNELSDPANLRFQYPFTNCTNCGPRYSIISDLPYDRCHTTMENFVMCHHCANEYADPQNRRFHAQPNACKNCGPKLSLFDSCQTQIKTNNIISTVQELVLNGYIIAVKGIGGFHLMVDAQNHQAISRLRRKKSRKYKPLALMSFSVTHVSTYAQIDNIAVKHLNSKVRPIVVLAKKTSSPLSSLVAPKINFYGVMLPYTPLHYLLLENDKIIALVMTSANAQGEPIIAENDDAFEKLKNIADYFLIHNRQIQAKIDDSIVKQIGKKIIVLRRARGMAPLPIFLKKKTPPILACGAELKNTFCLTKDNLAFMSPYIGDLKNFETYSHYENSIKHLSKILNIEPEIIVHDHHPDYLSTTFATTYSKSHALNRRNIQVISVQHHHAHIASCMAEYNIEEPVLGVALDGTGYGDDGHLWGGEILVAAQSSFERVAHLKYMPMPGGGVVAKEPWRMAISYLYDSFDHDFYQLKIPFFKANMGLHPIKVMASLIQANMNCPKTSSVGRLFDGVASILGICHYNDYEAQAAIELENIAAPDTDASYPYGWDVLKYPIQIEPAPIIKKIVSDLENRVPIEIISRKFHNTVCYVFIALCTDLARKYQLKKIVLSGGVFQNKIILSQMVQGLVKNGFLVYANQQSPLNDGGISLGQAFIAQTLY